MQMRIEIAYALNSSTIDLCLSLFPWAKFSKKKAAVKMHTLLDLRGSIPTFIEITDGKVHDVNVLDLYNGSCLRRFWKIIWHASITSILCRQGEKGIQMRSDYRSHRLLPIKKVPIQNETDKLLWWWVGKEQHLQIKKFYGTSFNAVCTQICIAVSIYLLVAIIITNWNCSTYNRTVVN